MSINLKVLSPSSFLNKSKFHKIVVTHIKPFGLLSISHQVVPVVLNNDHIMVVVMHHHMMY